ncbi:MAG: AAA family ATPase [Albidovulum sp.]|nr:AAA family ATPase [Albidovulum sp.]
MRLPTEAELSREQREVCSAPSQGTALVIGPPGSGKTVVAVYRKRMLERMGEPVTSVAWNNVLARYGDLDKTFERWLYSWWKKATGMQFPTALQKNRHIPDYKYALKEALGRKRSDISHNGNWGHLILDEAQDFSQPAHKLLSIAHKICEDVAENPPSMLILADENQRITDSNATFNAIREAHSLFNDEVYCLTKNYRNTREIASVAKEFFIGTVSGMPELPDRRGDKPKLLTSCPIDDAVKKIANHARNHEDHEIGVMVYYDATRKKFFNKLKHRLAKTDIYVQSYFADPRQGGGPQLAQRLRFDRGGTITVLCYASAKGVEFDSVFLPELQQMRASGEDGDVNKMQLYVMASRARTHLTLMMDDAFRASSIWKLLPGDNQLNKLFNVN